MTALRRPITPAIYQAQTFYGVETRPAVAPTFTKYASNPVFSSSGSELPSIIWPWVLRVDSVIASPRGKYYMWYSTDHEGASGEIGLAYANSPFGPWTDVGSVYQDTSSGSETETPSVIWNDDEDCFFMYYQQISPSGANASQATCLATSTDGETWTRVGIAVDIPTVNDGSGYFDGHTGYFRPHRIGGKWVAHTLASGGSGSTSKTVHFAIAYSNDGRSWTIDPRYLGYESHLVDGTGPTANQLMRVEWNSTSLFRWGGNLWWAGYVSSHVVAANDRNTYLAVAPISTDLRSLVGKPTRLFTTNAAWESNYYSYGNMLTDGNRLYLYYRSQPKSSTEAFGVAYATLV